ncbi:MAG: MFS transporter [Sphingomonadales bacterium]|nr:MFS transporter [Sphingomonadales bacterium]
MTDTALKQRRTGPMVLVGLIALSLFINYIDRGNLATGAVQISKDLHLSTTAYGSLLSAFYLTYTLCQLPGGALADRWGGKLVLGLGALLWSISTLMTAFVSGFFGLIVLRMLLGMGESVAFSTSSKLIAANVPARKIGLANGIIGFGYLVGPAVGTLVGGKLMAVWDWRPVFILFGALSLLWLLPWSRVRVLDSATDAASADAAPVPLRAILRQRGLWGAGIGHFAGNWNWYFVLGYLPMYLQNARGFALSEMASVVSAAYLVNAVAALFGGWAIDRAIASGRSASLACKVPMALAHAIGLFAMLAIPTMPLPVCLAALFAYQIFLGLSSPGYFIIPQIMAGPRAAARWVGVQNMIGNLPGIIATLFAGILIDAGGKGGGSYFWAFALAAAINVVGLVGWLLILPRVEAIDWEQAKA